MTGVRELRVLCLHGLHGSAAILRSQMAELASEMPANVEFVYLDAPSLSSGDFGWWRDDFRGWERTLEWAIDVFDSQPRFDGIFGFSQGAALAGLLAAVNQSEQDGSAGKTWFDFAVMVGGFKSDPPSHSALFRSQLTLPSAHVMGQRDVIIPIGQSRELANQFAGPLVLEHSGGHVVPGIEAVTDPLARFFTDMAGAPVEGVAHG
jgi:pimeloyl-ACP methyl ester carboxylesterase